MKTFGIIAMAVLVFSAAALADHDIAIPYYAPEGIPTIDGDLADWAGVTFIPLDIGYSGGGPVPVDLSDCAYAVQWSSTENLLYVAVTVTDTEQYLEPNWVAWNGHDDIEVYVDANNNDVDYSAAYGYAQQIFMGAYPGTDGWAKLGGGMPSIEVVADFTAAINGDVLTYELAIVPFAYYTGLGAAVEPQSIVTLAADLLIGLDIAVGTLNTGGTAFGMAGNNTVASKFRKSYALQDWILVGGTACSPGDADGDGDVDLDDFVILKTNFGTTSGADCSTGDFDGDGDVDLDDFVLLKSNFGS